MVFLFNVRQSRYLDQNQSRALCSAYTATMSDTRTDIDALYNFVESNDNIVVLTGAGTSVSSGIPTYRDALGTWRGVSPITHDEFLRRASRRQRYWTRSMLGWPGVRDAQPNAAHLALCQLEQIGKIHLLITQNVDRLHQRAGSGKVVDLHGRLDRVQCLECSHYYGREQIQAQLVRENPWVNKPDSDPRPDGDADVPEEWVNRLRVPTCTNCDGLLKPDVVFFGGTVPKERVQTCMDAIEASDAILAVGSSLQVFSGYRFCRGAARMGKAVGLINPGITRADELANMKLHADCGPLLAGLVKRCQPDG